MIIQNKTNQIQEISVINRDNSSLTYSIYIRAKCELEVDNNLVIQNLANLLKLGVLAIKESPVAVPVNQAPIVEETKTEEVVPSEPVEIDHFEFPEVEESVEVEETQTEVEETTEETSSDVIHCDVCGKEFASQRSLTMHMNKSHKE